MPQQRHLYHHIRTAPSPGVSAAAADPQVSSSACSRLASNARSDSLTLLGLAAGFARLAAGLAPLAAGLAPLAAGFAPLAAGLARLAAGLLGLFSFPLTSGLGLAAGAPGVGAWGATATRGAAGAQGASGAPRVSGAQGASGAPRVSGALGAAQAAAPWSSAATTDDLSCDSPPSCPAGAADPAGAWGGS